MGHILCCSCVTYQENLYTDSESYPCAQQKLLIPIDLQQYKIPAVLVPSVNFLTLSKTDLLWRNGLISMDDRHGIATFLDNDTQPSDDLIAYDLNRIRKLFNCLYNLYRTILYLYKATFDE